MSNISRGLHTETGKIGVSIILGLGLASLFRKACAGRNCMVFRPPSFEEVKQNTYLHDNKCYRFRETSTKCGQAPRQIAFA